MSKKRIIFVSFILVILSVVVACFANLKIFAFAADNGEGPNLLSLCEQFTEDEVLVDEKNNKVLNLNEYPNYVSERFDTSNVYNDNVQVYDEWITNIVPVQLFEQKIQDFLFIGKSYGFYFNYNENENTFLIYLIKHNIKQAISGQIVRKIEPYYYEKYKLNEDNNLSILYYNNYSQHYFREYNKVKKIYLKDVSFSGSLYNQFHVNQCEDWYIDENDKGGYFIGNQYIFSGVSTQTGKSDFSANILKTTAGYLPVVGDVIGAALDIWDIIDGVKDLEVSSSNEYREIKSNTNSYGVNINESIAPAQIEKYGHLLKASYSYIQTPNDENAVLLGINNNCYAQNTFFVNYAEHYNRWDTLFAGQISLDIVEEENTDSINDSTIKELKTRVTSNDYYYNLDNNEQFEINEDELLDLYILGNAELKLNFIAPVNGTYTFESYSNEVIEFKTLNENVELFEENKKIAVTLSMNDTCNLRVKSRKGEGACKLKIDCKFTPEKINLNTPVQRIIKSNETEYLLIMTDVSSPFDLSLVCDNEIETGLYADNREKIVGDLLNGKLLETSYYIDGNRFYYLALHNYSNNDIIAKIELKDVNALKAGEENTFEISDSRYFKFSPKVTSEFKFASTSAGVFELELYDNDNKFLASTLNSNTEFTYLVERDRIYNVLVRNISHNENCVKILVNPNPIDLKFGENDLYQITYENCYKFVPKLTASYSISLTANNFTIYDSHWNAIGVSNDGYYYLNNEVSYFIVVIGSTQEFFLTVDMMNTTQESGLIPDSGEVIVKFVPKVTAKYEIEGAENIEWYDINLIKVGTCLVKGNTYFAKIKGQVGTAYSIKQWKEYINIPVGRLVNLYDGSYTFTIESAGNYAIMIYCGKNTVNFTLYDGNDKEIKLYNAGSGNFELYLISGVYTFDLSVSTSTTAGIKIKSK